jgi:3-oxoacyl-[acyl-carrier protein] reductase
MSLEGRVIIVTGGSRGIGRAIAVRLAAEGARVAIIARHREPCEAAAGSIAAWGGCAVALPADVSDEAQVARMAAQAEARWGRVDGLVNAAGVGLLARLPETTLALWQRSLDVNLTGTFLCCRAVWEAMARQGHGSILNIASSAVNVPHPGWSAYCASKAGVVALTRVLAQEGHSLGIRVNALLPSATATRMRLSNFPTDDPDELLTPEDVAAAVPFFFRDDTRHVSGEQIEVRKAPRGAEEAMA